MQDFRTWTFFRNTLLLTACLLGLWGPSSRADWGSVSIVSTPETPAEGQDVLLSLGNAKGPFRKIDWYRGQTADGTSRIFSYFPDDTIKPQRNGSEITGRELGFPNGSLLITKVRPGDSKKYIAEVLLEPKGALKGSTQLHLKGSGDYLPVVTNLPTRDPPQVSSMIGWIAAGIVVGLLLAGTVGAAVIYWSVMHKAEPSAGMAGILDLREKKAATSKHDDQEATYGVIGSPAASSKWEGKEGPPLFALPPPPLPDTCSMTESSYMELLCRTESIYTEIKR